MADKFTELFVQSQKAEYSRCLHPSLNCGDPAIRAHSIQNSRVLDLVQTDNQVIMPRYNLVNGEPKLAFKPVGRNQASTFTGLCSEHDISLFKAIDTEDFDDDNRLHRNQLAYRSVMHELHTELEVAMKFHAMHVAVCKERKHDPEETVTPFFLQYTGWMDKSRRVFKYGGRHFDRPRESGREPCLRHLIITMDNQAPVLACSSLFSTGFTADGDIIGPTLNVIPLNATQSVALLSCPAEQWGEVRRSLANVFDANEKTLKYELAKLIIQRVENFTLSPAHYEKWSDDRKARVLREFEGPPEQVEDHSDLNIFL
jgi:hypothetical protein